MFTKLDLADLIRKPSRITPRDPRRAKLKDWRACRMSGCWNYRDRGWHFHGVRSRAEAERFAFRQALEEAHHRTLMK